MTNKKHTPVRLTVTTYSIFA